MKRILFALLALIVWVGEAVAQSPLNYNLPNERILLGNIAQTSIVKLRGRNTAIGTSSEHVWMAGGNISHETSAVLMEVGSTSANDAAAGTGARTVAVDCVKSDYSMVTETVTLNGLTYVDMTNTCIRINGLRVLTVGSGNGPAGLIRVRTDAGSSVNRYVSSTGSEGLSVGQDADFFYTIPAGYVGILRDVSFSATGVTGDLSVWIQKTHPTSGLIELAAEKVGLANTLINTAQGKFNLGSGILIEEQATIAMRALVSAGVGDIVATGELVLIDKGYGNGLGF